MIRKIAALALFIIILLLAFGLIRQISTALQASKRLDSSADTVNKLQDENRKLKKRLTDVEQDDYIEQQARDKLNFARPNETVVIIPQSELDKVISLYKTSEPIAVPNWQKWLNLIFK
ncbi:hypothetical protein A2631_05515 [Candidatus Daviesbacteria bacterium RIFCSPHIGHO2_01_FULL_44_29]|uniref:Cell division protein FtsL n=1 Tax=Candidatus Daviesbacteria bacterium RIFCSPHIGHO2_02_FULL_43_12 TaxID=1797776 RepID=A0A1F5KI54_9BACT|nr:MAG: hypothetical protein A2631_05515 [Candidatus Daviesbacteria bacterium RIFCSPHIGHO2_01_FULL_44_29]OGE40592.1 MAG: hypothetical protein A3D25_00550 [Candidatus Daviesbacteria bacterium RIFCSPHIGHO2_02_FULL_43_12]OGE70152.1 MAG: hypothetical protein A3B55_00320 [Candidatus Daviesbacteria bacterium RIFCSPLOWO2_01_FULL_43_15]